MERRALTFRPLSVVLIVALLAGLAACASRNPVSAPELKAGAQYVALGSSYAAGAGIGPLQPGSPPRCQRTTNNYASLLARRFALQLTDVSCGGATTGNLLQSQDDLPAQLDAVTESTRLVTVTVGGNDLDYMGVLFGGSCRAGVAARQGPCPPVVEPGAAQYERLEAAMNSIAREIAGRAPRARLVFVQYLAVVPDRLCASTTISPEDAAIGRRIGRRLAAITKRVAAANQAGLLPADRLSRDHSPCAAVPWSHGFHEGYDNKQGAPWHPAPAGHAAIAEELATVLMR